MNEKIIISENRAKTLLMFFLLWGLIILLFILYFDLSKRQKYYDASEQISKRNLTDSESKVKYEAMFDKKGKIIKGTIKKIN